MRCSERRGDGNQLLHFIDDDVRWRRRGFLIIACESGSLLIAFVLRFYWLAVTAIAGIEMAV
jgi:hypothetical protein